MINEPYLKTDAFCDDEQATYVPSQCQFIFISSHYDPKYVHYFLFIYVICVFYALIVGFLNITLILI
jgi:hypothetical protein